MNETFSSSLSSGKPVEPQNVLVIDTSSHACCLGVSVKGQVFSDVQVVDRTHSKVILPRIVDLLAAAEIEKEALDLIVFGQGPGSFTGLRIGIGVVQGLAFGLNIPVVAVSSLASLAQTIYRQYGHKHSLVALTARKEEVYFGAYAIENEIALIETTEAVVDVSDITVLDKSKNWVGVGTGWALKSEIEAATAINIGTTYVDGLYPQAEDLLMLGLAKARAGFCLQAFEAQPQYLREQVAVPPKKPTV